MKKVFTILCALLVAVFCLSSCQSQDKKNSEFKIDLNSSNEYLIVGEQYMLMPQAGGNHSNLEWSSDDANIAEVKHGLVVAKAVGACKIMVKSNMSMATCKVTVCDSMVAKQFDKTSVGYNKVRFNTLQQACDVGGSVVVYEGDYAESLNLDKKVKIKAVGNVVVLGVYGGEFSLDGLSVQNSVAPPENKALVYAEKSMELKNCKIMVNTTQDAEKLQGGSGVSIASHGQKLQVKDCVISNMAIGIDVYHFMGEIDIAVNSISKCKLGVSVNVRASEKMVEDYPTAGVVRGNSYMDNWQDAQFLYSGSSYSGKLDFYDFSKLSPMPKPSENE